MEVRLNRRTIPDIFIPRFIELSKQGRFPFDRMIKSYPSDQINKAVVGSEEGKVLKPVLHPYFKMERF